MNWQSFQLGVCAVFSQYHFVGFFQGNSVLVICNKDDAKALVISRSFWNYFNINIPQYLSICVYSVVFVYLVKVCEAPFEIAVGVYNSLKYCLLQLLQQNTGEWVPAQVWSFFRSIFNVNIPFSRDVVDSMVQHFKVTIFGDRRPVYDGKRSLYTANPLPVATTGVRELGRHYIGSSFIGKEKTQLEILLISEKLEVSYSICTESFQYISCKFQCV